MAKADELPSKESVNKAGRRLATWLYDIEVELSDEELRELALPVSTGEPSTTGRWAWSCLCREWSDRYSTSGIKPSQRLKRFAQILDKLGRHPEMKLARMQDVGGARAVLSDRDEVEKVHQRIQ